VEEFDELEESLAMRHGPWHQENCTSSSSVGIARFVAGVACANDELRQLFI